MSSINNYSQNNFSKTLPDSFFNTVDKNPHGVAIRDLIANEDENGKTPYLKKFQEIITTWKDYKEAACGFAKGLIAVGLEPHHAVTIQGNNSSKWMFTNMGTLIAGGISTGVYPTNNPELSQHSVKNSGATVVVAEDEKQLEKYIGLNNSAVKCFVVWNKVNSELSNKLCAPVYTWNEFLENGQTVSEATLNERMATLSPEDVCCLLYTSGTTDLPKAAALTHINFTSALQSTAKRINLNFPHVGISYLPLSHIAAQMLDIVAPIFYGFTINIAPSDALKGTNLKQHILHTKPTYFLAVPRVWEKFMEAMIESGKTVTGFKEKLKNVRRFFADDLKNIPAKQNIKWNDSINPVRRAVDHFFVDRMNHKILTAIGKWNDSINLVRRAVDHFFVDRMNHKILTAIGLQNCQVAASGAGAIDPKTIDYFKGFGISIGDIYGLSETTGPLTISRNLSTISSGRPISGTTLIIADQDKEGKGEIRVKGPNIFKEYWNNPKATQEAFDKEGFFCTGDEGKLVDGNLYITGRLKELIKTSGGENIPPVRIEQKIKEILPIIDHAVVIGNKRNYLTCLITLQTELDGDSNPTNKLAPMVIKELEKIGSTAKTLEEAHNDSAVMKYLMEGIKQANGLADSQAQFVQKITLLPQSISVVNGLMTPTQKLKRSVIEKQFANYIEKMYEV